METCAVRKTVPIVDFSKSFEEQVDNIKLSFEAVDNLYELSKELDIFGIYQLLE